MYREFQDSREGFDAATAAEYEAYLDAHDHEWPEGTWESDMYDEDGNCYNDDEPWDGFRDDVEADADVLRSCGWGTDEDYGYYGYDE